MKKMNLRNLAIAGMWMSGSILLAWGDVKMPAIFGDHMVLQEGAKIPVWGWADPNEPVQVTLDTVSGNATAGADGKWRVDLAPVPDNGGKPVVLTVKGKNTLTFQDVLIGEVWVGSGQSNMGLPVLQARDGATEAAQANDPQFRLFQVTRVVAPTPQSDIVPRLRASPISARGKFARRTLPLSIASSEISPQWPITSDAKSAR